MEAIVIWKYLDWNWPGTGSGTGRCISIIIAATVYNFGLYQRTEGRFSYNIEAMGLYRDFPHIHVARLYFTHMSKIYLCNVYHAR